MSLTLFLGALLAFVKAPGRPHCPTAVLLLGKARERFATLDRKSTRLNLQSQR